MNQLELQELGVYVGEQDLTLRPGGSLCDVAPTLLQLMELEIPPEMTGKTLVASR